jgi:FAD/FMN-containing dehydrogenase
MDLDLRPRKKTARDTHRRKGTTAVPASASAAEHFKSGLRGAVLRPIDDGYESARRVWNAMVDRRPSLIVRCRGASDIIRSVHFARDHALPLSVRGGGHNVAGNAVCDDGLMIDLSLMRAIRVSSAERTARAEAGCTWRDFDRETQAFQLGTTGGVIPETGIAGLTLGGGLGWLMRKHGLSCDNLLSVDLVLADGRRLTASAAENTELYWGLRGGGGNFGIAVSFQYRLHPVDKVLGGMVIHSLERAGEALKFLREFTRSAPDELTTMAVLLTAPDGNKALAIIVCFSGTLSDGERVLQPLQRFGQPVADTIAAMPYMELQSLLESGFPPGLQNYWKSNFLQDLNDEVIGIIVESFGSVPSPTSAIAVEQLGGAVSAMPEDATAFSHRKAPFNVLIVSSWPGHSDHERHIRWTRQLWQALQPHSTGGVYVNYLGQEADEGADRVRAAYGAQKYERLLALKQEFDPQNIFRMNQNIRPWK